MAQPIPDRIERELRGTLANLRSIHRIIGETRETLDERMGGNGRYEADAFLNCRDKIADGLRYVEQFRAIARSKDIDAEAAIADCGGLPEFRVSPMAMEWIEGALHLTAREGEVLSQIHVIIGDRAA